jgi:sentrin-specific protease 1
LNASILVVSNHIRVRLLRSIRRTIPGKDIFALDKIFVPINKGMSHWVCAVIYMQEKRIQFYDSLGADGKDYLRHLLRYLKDDHKDKKNVPLPDPKSWKLVSCDRETTPQQPNGELLLSAFGVADFP